MVKNSNEAAAYIRHMHKLAGLKLVHVADGPNGPPYLPDKPVITTYSESDPWSLHDLAHYIVAHPESREMVNFGLGEDVNEPSWGSEDIYYTHRYADVGTVGYDEWEHQEDRALAMHFFLVKEVFGSTTAHNVMDDGKFRFHEREPAAAVLWVHDKKLVSPVGAWSRTVNMGDAPHMRAEHMTLMRMKKREASVPSVWNDARQ